MGLMTKLFGGGNDLAATGTDTTNGDHAIERDRVMAPTAPGVFSPTQPGSLDTMRSAPIVPSPRYFTREEANALSELANQRKSQATHTKRAYKHLRSLEDSDTEVTKQHYRYARKVASKELEKVDARTKYAKRLHGLRSGYASLGAGYDRAENQANESIAAIKAAYK